jgi:hypothetical protein
VANQGKKSFFMKLSKVSAMHYGRLIFRSLLFLTALGLYIASKVYEPWKGKTFGFVDDNYWILGVLWLVYFLEMVFRLVPARFESLGSQKHFDGSYKPRECFSCSAKCGKQPCDSVKKSVKTIKPINIEWWRTMICLLAWVALNGVIGGLHFAFSEYVDNGILVLVSLAYGVCDMICVLFYCPFQSIFMKNKCCTTCRIYNWDYAMMFTPLIFFINPYGWSLLGISLLVLLQWEITLKVHPERFAENTNQNLACENCEEHLCHHKKQLRGYMKKQRERIRYLSGYYQRKELEKEETALQKQMEEAAISNEV